MMFPSYRRRLHYLRLFRRRLCLNPILQDRGVHWVLVHNDEFKDLAGRPYRLQTIEPNDCPVSGFTVYSAFFVH